MTMCGLNYGSMTGCLSYQTEQGLCSARSLEMQPVGIECVGALNVWTFACP